MTKPLSIDPGVRSSADPDMDTAARRLEADRTPCVADPLNPTSEPDPQPRPLVLTASIGQRGATIHFANDYNHPLTFSFYWDEFDEVQAVQGPALARLITGASGLLEAVVELREAILDAKYTTEHCQRALHRSEAAIAKAKP